MHRDTTTVQGRFGAMRVCKRHHFGPPRYGRETCTECQFSRLVPTDDDAGDRAERTHR